MPVIFIHPRIMVKITTSLGNQDLMILSTMDNAFPTKISVQLINLMETPCRVQAVGRCFVTSWEWQNRRAVFAILAKED